MSQIIARYETKELASIYYKYRPNYQDTGIPKLILEYLHSSSNSNNTHKQLSLAIDVGCGQGQMVDGLVEHFDKILGVDVSEGQIQIAKENNFYPNVEFIVGQAENLPVEDNSVDLITVGEALHWFDWSRFYQEVDRVLKPGGVIAIAAYAGDDHIADHPRHKELSEVVSQAKAEIKGKGFWHERIDLVLERYRDPHLQIPYANSTRFEPLPTVMNGTIESFFKFHESLCFIWHFLQVDQENKNMWKNVISRFQDVYGDGNPQSPLTVKSDMALIMGRKP